MNISRGLKYALASFLLLGVVSCGSELEDRPLQQAGTRTYDAGDYDVEVASVNTRNGTFRGVVRFENLSGPLVKSYKVEFTLDGDASINRVWRGSLSGRDPYTFTSPRWLRRAAVEAGGRFTSGFIAKGTFAGASAKVVEVNGQPVAAGDPDGEEPLFASEFTDLSGFGQRIGERNSSEEGSIGIAENAAADDNSVLSLTFPGKPELEPGDNVSPDHAVEVYTDQTYLYGRYELRARFATCSKSEELVNGLFTYFNDGSDKDGNGLADTSEIDIEVLCGQPNYLSLTVWTDYQAEPEEKFLKNSRIIDMRDGSYLETAPGDEGIYDVNQSGELPNLSLSDFPNPEKFYHLGFEWREDFVRYFIVLDGTEVELWRLDRPGSVPQRPAAFLFNLWHSGTHWFSGGEADYPANDAAMQVDWLRISK